MRKKTTHTWVLETYASQDPIVVDPQLPPLLHLLHLEVLVVAGLVVVT